MPRLAIVLMPFRGEVACEVAKIFLGDFGEHYPAGKGRLPVFGVVRRGSDDHTFDRDDIVILRDLDDHPELFFGVEFDGNADQCTAATDIDDPAEDRFTIPDDGQWPVEGGPGMLASVLGCQKGSSPACPEMPGDTLFT